MTNLILIITFFCFCGSTEKVKQEYIFIEDSIQFKMKVDNYRVTAKDTLAVEIEVTNESDHSIYVVPTFHFNYVMDSLSNIPNGVYLDFGGGINENISDIPFTEIKPEEVKSIAQNFICDNFRYDKFSNEIYFSLWLGYINPENALNKYTLRDNYIYLADFNKKDLKKFLVGSIKVFYTN